jgi:hypothetical protein
MRDSIGRYQLRRQLGEGGMGLVYEAWDDRLGRLLALKVMRPSLDDAVVRERFRREARAAGAINHPNICHVYEIGEDAGELFIAMERLDGESLAERLQRGPLPPADAIQVALGIRPMVLEMLALPTFIDPEAHFHGARLLARIGDEEQALRVLRRAIDGGYCGMPAVLTDRWLDPLRTRAEFRALLDRAAADRRAALDAFIVAGGERVLGVAGG